MPPICPDIFAATMKRIALALALFTANVFAGDNWPEFRGPAGNGQSDSKGLPVTWSETEHVKWKTPIHDKGWSSPVIWGNQVWLTTATEEGKEMYGICLDKETGKIIHDLKLFSLEAPPDIRKYNSYASPTPVIEEGRVYITFGSAGTACVDTKTGKKLWERTDIKCNHFRGAGSSPIIFGDLLILNYDGSDHQFVMAFNKKTGKTAWETKRTVDYKDVLPDGKIHADGDFRKAFATCHVATFEGKPVLLSSGAKAHYGYDPLTGKELWRIEEAGQHSAATRPLAANGVMYFTTGFSKGQLIAIKPPVASAWGGCVSDLASADDPTPKKPQVLWSIKKAVANKPSLLLVDGAIFMLTDGGVASCIDAKSGEIIWTERPGGDYSASPVYADGKIYFNNVEGKSVVIEAARQYKVLAENKLPEGSYASPAISGKAMFLRTKTALYRLEN
jgi:outer membrane protein assembly factor BamB